MRKRLLKLIGVTAVILSAAVLFNLAPVTVAGQTPAAKAGSALKTAWGEPDLQGIWTDEFQTPLQRPAKFATREFFTDQERAEFGKQRAGLLGRDNLTAAKWTVR